MTRFLLLLAAGLTSAQAVGFQVPRYRLAPGTKIWCTGISDTKDSRGTSHGTRLREHWILSDSGGVFKVLMRVTDQSYKIDTAGKRTADTTETGWELFEMKPNGELLRDQSTTNIDVAGFFPLLPDDSASAVNGWTQVDTSNPLPSTYNFRLDNKSGFDSLWLIDRSESTPLDNVYGIPTRRQRSVIDTRRGLPLRRESGSSDSTSHSESHGSITLDSVTKFDAANLQPQLRDMISYFDVQKATEAEFAKSDPDDTSGTVFRRVRDILQEAAARMHDSTATGLVNGAIKQLEQGQEYSLSETRNRLQWLGKPAPGWELTDLAGKKHALKDYRGKVLVLDWWYKGCPWCMLAMPELTEVAHQYADRPVVILGMNVDRDVSDARSAIEKMKPGYPSLLAGRDLAGKYRVTGYPTLFIVDKKGKIADVHFGYSNRLAAGLSKKLDALLGP
jgi:thiol-disulfide isomerase/thioredoxin